MRQILTPVSKRTGDRVDEEQPPLHAREVAVAGAVEINGSLRIGFWRPTGNSGHVYTFTRLPDGRTAVDAVVVRDGKNLRGHALGLVLALLCSEPLKSASDGATPSGVALSRVRAAFARAATAPTRDAGEGARCDGRRGRRGARPRHRWAAPGGVSGKPLRQLVPLHGGHEVRGPCAEAVAWSREIRGR